LRFLNLSLQLRPLSLYFVLLSFSILMLQGCTASPFAGQQPSDPPPPTDSTAPTAPTNLVATASSGTQVGLSWTASTDNVGVTGYMVERCIGNGCAAFVQIATATVTSYADSGLLNNTSYGYRVRATDAKGNLTSYSNVSYVNTPKGTNSDTTPPTAPTSLAAAATSSTQVNLTWGASTDNVTVTGYFVERCTGTNCSSFAQVGVAGTTNFSETGLIASTSYSYRVRAKDAAGNASGYSNTSSATTQAGSDTTPPTAPSGLAATASSSTQIGLTWTASTDNVGVTGYRIERCTGSGCSSFAQIGSSTVTSFFDSGLTASTSYSYRVRATDAAGNLSNFSNTASPNTPAGSDTTPPRPPSGLAATASSSTQIGLTWTASTDNVGVTGYRIERCTGSGCSSFTQIGTTTGATTFSNSGLTASTSYSYRVRATDAAGHLSNFSNTSSATTPAGSDTTPPTPPIGLAATASSSTQIGLTWTASTDNVGVTGYRIERCTGSGCTSFAQIGSSSVTSFSDSGRTASTSYSYRVRATDAAGHLSNFSNTSSATTPAGSDTTPPTPPTGLAATASSSTRIGLTWTASTDNVGVTGYRIERCTGSGCSSFMQIGTTTGATTFSNSGLTASTSYSYRVRATDAAGHLSNFSNTSSATTPAGSDTTPPTPPSGLAATASSSTQIGLTWTASTDNVGVTGYRIERCTGSGCSSFVQIGTTTGATTFSNSGLTASTSYSYRVRATDAAGHLSNFSNTSSATTPAGSDTTPPTPPTGLAAAASSSTQIGLTWIASTDNVGVTGYRIERCTGSGCSSFVQIGTTTGATTFSNSGLTASTSYSYRVRATDAAGHLSNFSNTSSATTPAGSDTTPPTPPTGLAAAASSSTQIGLTWIASTDNVGVTGYRIERCTGSGCSSFVQIGTTTGATTFSNSGLTASTSYSYRVRATDAAGHLSNFSNTASATTPSSGGSITVSVSPRRGGLTTSRTLSITATLTNDKGNQGVTWSSTGGGSFSPTTSTSGNAVTFTAPTSAGVVTITATSVADGSKTASATIGVTDLRAVPTYLNGNSRQGANLQEYALATSGPTAVNSTNFGKLFSCTVDAAIYAQPLWVANVSIGGSKHNVVYVATQHDTVYAFDADASPCATLWQTGVNSVSSLLPSGQTWVTSRDTCPDLQPDIGIVGTPVIDLGTDTMYLVTKSKTSGTTSFHQMLHALDITTGREKLSGPVEISASVSGSGNGGTGGVVKFDPLINNQRPALLLENGHVVISWSSHCDNGAYHGWVISYSASGLAQEAVWNDSPNGALGGIWMSGDGPAADSSGNIYLVTGNGSFDASNGGYGDSIVKLGPPSGGTFPVATFFTPLNEASLSSTDTDQGSGGLLLLPDITVSSVTKSYLVQAGKDGRIYLGDRSSLGGFNSSINQIFQEVSGQLPGGMWGSPTYWNGSVYFAAAQDGASTGGPVRAFSFNAGGSGMISGSPTSHSAKTFTFPGPTSPISSSNENNGILWALDNSSFGAGCPSSCQVVYAFDASNLATQLYSSSQAAGSRDQDGGAVKFTVPTVANGKVYAGGDRMLTIYGLLP
jgi:chitodextrinase